MKKLAEELGLARVLVVNMLDRERADFFRTLGQIQEQFSSRCVAVHIPIGVEHELEGIVDVLHMCAYINPDGQKEGDPVAIPDAMQELAQEYREKLLDEVVQIDEALMERYLEGEELDPHEVAAALKLGVTRGEIFPVGCSVASKNLGTHALLDLLIEGVPSPAQARRAVRRRRGVDRSVRLQDDRRPVRREDQPLPRAEGRGDDGHDASRPSRAVEGADGLAARTSRARRRRRSGSSARATSAPSRS